MNTYFPDCDKSQVIRQASWSGTPLDLAHEQLSGLLGDTSDELVLVPSSLYSDRQLEYLVGAITAMAAPITVVPLPLAYSRCLPPGRYALIEPEVHDIVLTELDIDDGLATIAKPKVFFGLGLQRFYSEQFQSICDHFIERHRYDVGHAADNKFVLLQQLHQHWSDVENEIRLRVDDREVSVEKKQLMMALPQPVLDQVGERQCLLIPSQLVPLQHIFTQSELLPCLDRAHSEVLTRDMLQLHPPAGESVRVFDTIAHPIDS